MGRINRFFILLTVLIVLAGCGSKVPYTLVDDFAKKGTRLVAVLPPVQEQKTPDLTGARILREKAAEELYYKGYPRLPLASIDERLALAGGQIRDSAESARSLERVLGVDAVLFITVEECSTSYFLTSAKVAAAVRFTLRSTRTGEVLWGMRVARTKRAFHVTRKWLQEEVVQIYEPLLRELVTAALATLPDGPDV
jgi:hypothetical protein